jgi:hypothetical protein
MVKKDETVEPTVTVNRKKLVLAGWIAGGVLALGATFAAGAAVGPVIDGPRGGDSNASSHAGPNGEQGPMDDAHGERGERGERGMGKHGDGHRGGPQGDHTMNAPTDGSTPEGSTPAPSTTP